MRIPLIVMVFLLGAPLAADPAATQALNDFRASQGRAALSYSDVLESVAARHAQDMARKGFFSHTGSDGSGIGQRLARAGYGWCFAAENIAQGQGSLGAVMTAWSGSAGHRRNMLNRKARAFGLARGPGNRWVMVLAAPC